MQTCFRLCARLPLSLCVDLCDSVCISHLIFYPSCEFSEAEKKMLRAGHKKWLKGFQKRWPELSTQKRRRALEQYKAMKAQPEITVKWFRLILHTYALMMIHRKIAKGKAGMVCSLQSSAIISHFSSHKV